MTICILLPRTGYPSGNGVAVPKKYVAVKIKGSEPEEKRKKMI